MGKLTPTNAADANELRRWIHEAQGAMIALHGVAVDAAAKERMYSRRELRRRTSRLAKRLRALFEALAPGGEKGWEGPEPQWNGAPPEKSYPATND